MRHFQATRCDRDAPNSNRRRGRVAPEQGYRLALRLACFLSLPRDRARKLWKKRTRNSRNASAPNARRARAACFLGLPRDRARKAPKQRTRNSRNAPAPNARRARAAREQGLHATHHTRNLDARDALATLASLCLLVLCSGSSRHCLCFSPRVFRRLRCLRLSLLTRFPFLVSQVSVFRVFFRTPSIFQKMPHPPHENLVF